MYSENTHLDVLVRLSFHDDSSFLSKEKLENASSFQHDDVLHRTAILWRRLRMGRLSLKSL